MKEENKNGQSPEKEQLLSSLLNVSCTNEFVSSVSSTCLECFFSVLINLRESNHSAPVSCATMIDESRSP